LLREGKAADFVNKEKEESDSGQYGMQGMALGEEARMVERRDERLVKMSR
jgi:hypothetical protein